MLGRDHNLGVVPARSQTRVCDKAEVRRQEGRSLAACPLSVPLSQRQQQLALWGLSFLSPCRWSPLSCQKT